MNLQMILERQSYLNYYVTESSGKYTSFKILHWGGLQTHNDHPIHKHTYFEACYILDGEGVYEENGQEYVINKHTLFLSRPGLWHKISSKQGISLIWISFELIEDKSARNLLKKLMESKTVCLHDASENTSVLFWKSLISQAEPEKSHWEEQLTCMTHVLLISFFQQFSDVTKIAVHEFQQPFAELIQSQLIYRIKRFIQDNLARTIRLKELSDYFNISERHLIRLFHHETGLNFSMYLQKERIEQAIFSMQITNLSLKEIAYDTGFSSVQHFTRIFKKATGETPARFRIKQYKS